MTHPPSRAEEERLRALLHESVSDVEPDYALDRIHRRTAASGRGRRPWLWAAGATVIATAATIAAVTVLAGQPGTTTGRDPGFADGSRGDGRQVVVPVYYVGDTGRGPRLFRELRRFTDPETDRPAGSTPGVGRAELAASQAVHGLPLDPDYRSDWPAGTYAGVDASGKIITVNVINSPGFQHRPVGMSPEEANLAVQQVVYTVQDALERRDPVRFELDGKSTDRVLGVPVAGTVTAADPAEVLAQVWITEPTEGALVQSPFQVTGLANAFEANVQWELIREGEVAKRGFATAKQCCTMAPYSFTVDAPPGNYTLVVHDTDPSGGEGFPPWQDTKQVTVAR